MKTSVTQEDVDNFIVEKEFMKLGQKSTLCFATLRNGFEISATSSCVDPSKYNQAIGEGFAVARIKEKVWELLGFHLQMTNWLNEKTESLQEASKQSE